jgi:5'-AMP-activated protein kinase regulatory beta subunit
LTNDYINEPPKLPPHLTEILLNQTRPTDPNMLPVPQHVVLNHLYYMGTNINNNLIVTAITQRFKPNSHTKITHKFVTTVYYAPKPENN